jgi:class 3 adenylate cyclase
MAPVGAVDCASCGLPLGQACPACGAFNPIRNRFCGECGGALKGADAAETGSAALKPAPKGAPHDPERRQLTILFGDLVGSTEIANRLDPEDMRDLMAAYYDCVGNVVRAHSGFLAKYLGDGVLLYFGYPAAREDDPENAVRAALALVQAVQRLEWRGERLSTRIGIATGARSSATCSVPR